MEAIFSINPPPLTKPPPIPHIRSIRLPTQFVGGGGRAINLPVTPVGVGHTALGGTLARQQPRPTRLLPLPCAPHTLQLNESHSHCHPQPYPEQVDPSVCHTPHKFTLRPPPLHEIVKSREFHGARRSNREIA